MGKGVGVSLGGLHFWKDMNVDNTMTVAELKDMIAVFIRDREWESYHTPKNIVSSIAIEAAELMEVFQWMTDEEAGRLKEDPEIRRRAGEEVADVVFYCLDLCNCLGLDFSQVAQRKMKLNEEKYPVERYRGKYDPWLKHPK